MPDHMKIEDMRARNADLEADNERLKKTNERWQQNMREAYAAFSAMRNDLNEMFPLQSTDADLLTGPEWSVSCAAIVKAANEALSRTGAVKVKSLEWREERPGAPHMWAHSPVGTYTINVYAGMKGGSFQIQCNFQSFPEHFYTEQQAKIAAQADYERRILSALEPSAPEGQQPVAHAYVVDGECEQIEWGLDVDLPDDSSLVLLYNRPSEQAVTETIAKIEQTFPTRTWGLLPRFYSGKKWGGLIFAEGSQDILKATIAAGDTPAGALNAALKAAMEAGR